MNPNATELTEEQEQDIINLTRQWLGNRGIEFFKDIKDMHGTLDAVWMEKVESDDIIQFLPRSIYGQEGKSLRRFLNTIPMGDKWVDQHFETKWEWLIEESIK